MIDFAPEFGTKFTLIGPGGVIATFNDLDDPNDVGVLSSISGLDSAEVRESGDVIVEFDGGVQGPNYYGRRPIVIEGLVYGHSTGQSRSAKLSRLMRATNAMRADAHLFWTPTVEDAIPVFITLRRQLPLRIEGAWTKTFQAAMIAADPRIYSAELMTLFTNTTEALEATNEGNSEAWPIYTLLGPSSEHIIISNAVSGHDIVTNTTLGLDDVLRIDTLNRTVHQGTRAPGSRVNYLKNPLQFFSGTSPWTSGTVGTLSVVTPPVAHPLTTTVLRTERPSGGTARRVRTTPAEFYAAAPGDVITAGVDVLLDATPPSTPTSINITFFASNKTTILRTDTINFTAASYPVGSWTRKVATSAAAPASTAFVEIDFDITVPLGQYSYFTAFTVEKAATDGSFFDGSHPLTGHSGGWYGTTGNSASSSFTTGYDAASLVPAYATIDFADTVWSGLQPGANLITAGWDAALPGAAFEMEWRHTWL